MAKRIKKRKKEKRKKKRSFKAKPKAQAEQENKLCIIHNAIIVPIVWESACLSRSFGFLKSFI